MKVWSTTEGRAETNTKTPNKTQTVQQTIRQYTHIQAQNAQHPKTPKNNAPGQTRRNTVHSSVATSDPQSKRGPSPSGWGAGDICKAPPEHLAPKVARSERVLVKDRPGTHGLQYSWYSQQAGV
ncbi:hypothetical protein BaRGS_00028920 [Batillaria attramentaria]|uniref:Uncharacterized protein n=1 Tax=Batillaria attramentaria TaxID=370345 RepID=A0ABD0JXI3_9CAEN